MKKFLFLIIIIAVLVIAAVTNPNQKVHQDAFTEKVETIIQDEMDTTDKGILGLVVHGLSGAIVDQVSKNIITSDNYVFFSLTKLNVADKHQVIGVGLFGNVFISNKLKDMPKEELNKLIK